MKEESRDKEITCVECGHTFIWTASGQIFFAEKGFSQPKRCKPCREARKQQKAA